MSEHIATETIKRYFNRNLKPDELLKADEHLAQCDSCLRKASDLGGIEKTAGFDFLRSAPDEFAHLNYEQLEKYADEKSDAVEREIADVHLETCADCSAGLDELFEMRKLIEADLKKENLVNGREPFFSRIQNIFSGKYVLRFGFAAFAILIFISGLIWVVNRNSSTEIAEIPSLSNISSPIPSPENSPAANFGQNLNANLNEKINSNTNTNSQPPIEDETEKLPPPYKAEIESVLAKNSLNFPAELKSLKNRSGTLMSGGSQTIPFALSNPVGKIVLSNRPQFRWQPLAGAQNYIVNIYDENFNPVAGSGQISAANWKINKPLARNKTYIWQVTAIKDGEEIKSPVRPAPDARFKILDAKKADELLRLSRQYKGEHLFIGILYARAGLLNEAESEFKKELAKNPNSKTAWKFLQDVRAKRK